MPHPWPVFTPEDNHTTLTRLGTGSATTLAYHAAVAAEVANLESITAVSAASAAGTYGSWQGVGSLASMVSQTGLNAATGLLAGWLAEKLPLVATTVSAYHSAAATMVPAEAAVANRLEEATDEQINPWVWGALTPRIAELNLDYFGHMWPRNAAAGAAYGAVARASAAAMLAVPVPPALSGGSAAAPAAAAATIAEDGGVSAAGATMRAGARAAEAVIAPAASAPQLAARAAQLPANTVVSGGVPLAGLRAPVAAASAAPVGMFAPMPTAAVPAPAGAMTAQTEVGEPVAGPRGGPVAAPGGYPGAGLTSYVRPADGFASPPPSGGRAAGLKPGMLNAAQLRGPLANPPTATAQPLAYPPPTAQLLAPPPPATAGQTRSEPARGGLPQPSAIAPAPAAGFGAAPLPGLADHAPLARPAPAPREPVTTSPGGPDSQETVEVLYEDLAELNTKIAAHNLNPPPPNNPAAVAKYNEEYDELWQELLKLQANFSLHGIDMIIKGGAAPEPAGGPNRTGP
ncbi:MAG TPA: PPE domain-containing protein [Mycobacterium sp.]|nr:PPE domain-containing protein [Mycobacterium sp.]